MMDQFQSFGSISDDDALPTFSQVNDAFDHLAANDPTVHSLLTRCLVEGQHDPTYQARLLAVILGQQVAVLHKELAEVIG